MADDYCSAILLGEMESIKQLSEERRQFVSELARALARKLAYEDYAAELEAEEYTG